MPLHECPSAEVLDRYAAGDIPAADAQTVDTHLSACTVCMSRLDDMSRRPDRLVAALRASHSVFAPTNAALGEAVAAVLSGTTSAPTPPGPELGALVNGYRIIEELGRGGMGRVYRAQHPRLNREVALKLLRPGLDSAHVIARFEAEREALARMDHPHIARVLDGGATAEDQPFFVMELVRGVRITRYCDGQRLDLHHRLGLFIDVCQAVQHAHQKGIIHRDLKPSNVLVAEYDGKPAVKVIDFGVAKALERSAGGTTEMGMLVGTLEYMSPEQADLDSRDIDTRSDIYALGVLLYEMLTGKPPLDAERLRKVPVLEVLRRIREEEPLPPSKRRAQPLNGVSVPSSALPIRRWQELDWIVLKALEKDRTRRYETAAGFADDVRRFLHNEPVAAGPPSRTYRVRKFVRRNRGAVLAACLILGALVGGAGVAVAGMVQAVHAERAARKAEGDALIAEDKAISERAISDAIRAFVEHDLLAQTGVRRQLKAGHVPQPNLTLREALDRAAQRLPGKFERQPLVEAGISQTIGEAYYAIGELAAADRHLQRALQLLEANLPADDTRIYDALTSQYLLRCAQGRFGEAQALAERTLEGYRLHWGPHHATTVQAMNHLASVMTVQSNFAPAEAILQEAAEIERQHLGPHHSVTLSTKHFLAFLYQWRLEYPRAEPFLREIYESLRETLGRDHLDTLAAAIAWGDLLLEMRRFDEAEPLLTAAHEALLRLAGPNDRSTSMAKLVLARLAHRKGDPERAEPMFTKILEKLRREHGPDHPDTLAAQFDLAVVYYDLRQYSKSDALFRSTLETQERVLGPLHFDTMRTISSYAGVCLALGQVDKAEAISLQALEARRKTLGPDSPATLDSQYNLSNLYAIQGKLDQALVLMAPVAEARSRQFGSDADETLQALRYLGIFQRDLGALAEAEVILRQYLDAQRRRAQGKRPIVRGHLLELAEVLVKQNKCSEAEPLLREALAIVPPAKATKWATPHLQSLLGGALMGQDKLAEAEPLLLEGAQGLQQYAKELPPGARQYLVDALVRVAQLYAALGKPEEAAKWRAKLPAPAAPKPVPKSS